MGLGGIGRRAAAALVAVVAGCTVGPDYHTPETPMPDRFAATIPAAAPKVDLSQWWRTFNDPTLDALVDEAIKSSPGIEIALTRLQEVRTAEAVVIGQALPSLEASGGAAKGTGTDLARGRASPPLIAGENGAGLKHVTQIVGFDAGWELDLFGKYRRELEAVGYDAEAAAAAREAVLIAVVADVARNYFELRGLQMRLAVAEQNVDTAKHTVDLVTTRFQRGLTNELDVTLAQRELATLEAQIAPFTAQIAAARYAIAVLLGKFPEEMAKELTAAGVIPPLPAQIETGLPLDLLRRRPDIHDIERQLAGATARIGVATADLFPHLALTAGAGWQGQGLGVSPAVTNYIWSAGPAAYWSLLDFGTLDALVDIADLRSHELLVVYRQTVQTAVQDVDTAIDAYAAFQAQLTALQDAITAAKRSVMLATERYNRGLTDFLNVLDAQRQEYALEDQFAAADAAAAAQLVALYKALGGGWEQYQSVPPVRTPDPAIIAAFRRLINPGGPTPAK
jgi:NodT family efflux transporter outer membrane factor (OMF) lipoprotein